MPKKSEKDIIVPKDAVSFLENGDKTGFKGLLGFKNLVELIKNESKKIQGELDEDLSLDRIRQSATASFNKKISPGVIEEIANCYGYYFYHFLNSEKSPLSVEESKAVCYYRVIKKVSRVAYLLEIDNSVCLKHLKKGARVLMLDSTYSLFMKWVEVRKNSESKKKEEYATLAYAPISNLKQYLPKSLVFTLSTKGQNLTEIFRNYSLNQVSKFKGMGKSKTELLKNFLAENNLSYLVE